MPGSCLPILLSLPDLAALGVAAHASAAALTNAAAVIDLLTDPAPEGSAINVSCSGYVMLREDGSNPLTTASVSASASYVSP